MNEKWTKNEWWQRGKRNKEKYVCVWGRERNDEREMNEIRREMWEQKMQSEKEREMMREG